MSRESTTPSVDARELREQVRAGARNRPGVYRMFDEADDVVYVGKSIRLRTRLLSYFRAGAEEKSGELMASTRRIEWTEVPNEFSALILEMRLIQRLRPRFNVQYKRQRRYAFVKITREPAPRVVVTGRVSPDSARYYGPFPAGPRLGLAVRELAHVLGLRDCAGSTPIHFSDQLELLDAGRSPLCWRAEIGTCPAPCASGCSESEYRDRIAVATDFLEGRTSEPTINLWDRMQDAADRKEFEYAALLRDRMERLRGFQEEMLFALSEIGRLSFVYRLPDDEGDATVYVLRRGRVRAEMPEPTTAEEADRAKARVREVLADVDRGAAGLTPEEAAETLLVARWFRTHPEELERTVSTESWLRRTPDAFEAGSESPGRA